MIMMHKARLLVCALSLTASAAFPQAPDVWMKLFNGKDLTGLKAKAGIWKVDSGYVRGMGALSENTFLIPDSMYSDFHLKLEGRMPGSGGYRNSGVVYRGKIASTTTLAMSGYQYEFSDGGTGAFYHERGNELGFTGGCRDAINGVSGWKKVEIIANGPKVTHLMDGKTCFTYSTFKVLEKGYIGLQLHSPGDFRMDFRNVYIKPLNNSFKVPDDNAWDSTGNQLNNVRIRLDAKRERAGALGSSGSVIALDARGRTLRPGRGGSGWTETEARVRHPGVFLIAR
jgi:hypothetical protein